MNNDLIEPYTGDCKFISDTPIHRFNVSDVYKYKVNAPNSIAVFYPDINEGCVFFSARDFEKYFVSIGVLLPEPAHIEGVKYCVYSCDKDGMPQFKSEVDNVNNPSHYKGSNGVESIDVIESFSLNFNTGNAVKYILRAGKKDPAKHKEDLEKAVWYLNRELSHLS